STTQRPSPLFWIRAAMSARPSPSKSAACTCPQFFSVVRPPQARVANPLPFDSATYHRPSPSFSTRTARSARPSPVKSPTSACERSTVVDQRPHTDVTSPLPVESPTQMFPVAASRAETSTRPSPLKSPDRKSTHCVPAGQAPQDENVKRWPSETPAHH